MAKIVPVVQLAAHAKSNTLYGRSYGRTVVQPNFFGLMGYYFFVWLRGYAARASRATSSPISCQLPKQYCIGTLGDFNAHCDSTNLSGNSDVGEKLFIFLEKNSLVQLTILLCS